MLITPCMTLQTKVQFKLLICNAHTKHAYLWLSEAQAAPYGDHHEREQIFLDRCNCCKPILLGPVIPLVLDLLLGLLHCLKTSVADWSPRAKLWKTNCLSILHLGQYFQNFLPTSSCNPHPNKKRLRPSVWRLGVGRYNQEAIQVACQPNNRLFPKLP